MKRTWVLFASLFLAAVASAASLDLNIERLTPSLKVLTQQDRLAVDSTVELIQKGDHTLALTQLTALRKTNPENSALGILTAYAMLQLGNLVGAFDEAKKAEKSEDKGKTSYACLFLAKLALLVGDKSLCSRELKHLKGAGESAAHLKPIEDQLKRKN